MTITHYVSRIAYRMPAVIRNTQYAIRNMAADLQISTGHWLLGATLLVGAVLRLIGLDRQGLWTDELYVAWEGRQPFDLLFDPRLHLQHPPGYRLAMHAWMGLSLDETWLRLLPAISGWLLIAAGWRLARALWPRQPWAAHCAAILIATSPFLLHYSQDITAYSWTALWVSLSFLMLVLAWRYDRGWLWAAWSLTLAISLYSHYFSFFPVLVQVAALIIAAVAGRRASLKRLGHACIALAGTTALCAPWAYILLSRGRDSLGLLISFPLTLDWQPFKWLTVLAAGYGYPLFWQWGYGQTLIPLLLGLIAVWIIRPRPGPGSEGQGPAAALLAGWGLAAILGPYLFLRVTYPPGAIDPARFAALAAPALLIALGAVVASFPAPVRVLAITGWLIFAGFQWRAELMSPPTQDWRGILGQVAAGAQQGDVFLAFPALHAGAAASYYQLPGQMAVQGGWFIPGQGGDPDTAYWFPAGWRWRGFFDTHADRSSDWAGQLRERTGNARRLWYLAGDNTDGTYPRFPNAEQELPAEGWHLDHEWHTSPLVLRLYTRAARSLSANREI
jgi:hypothetical protein